MAQIIRKVLHLDPSADRQRGPRPLTRWIPCAGIVAKGPIGIQPNSYESLMNPHSADGRKNVRMPLSSEGLRTYLWADKANMKWESEKAGKKRDEMETAIYKLS